MEDAVSVRPDFLSGSSMSHFFGVFDGDGCSHVRRPSLPAAECLDNDFEEPPPEQPPYAIGVATEPPDPPLEWWPDALQQRGEY
jgi:hypothetical protein